MSKDIFQKRELYLEQEYFRKKEFELLEKLKAVFQKEIDKESIRKATGVTNERLLDRLVEHADELRKALSPAELETFRKDLLERARAVVSATGHLERLLLNVGGERKILGAIEQALTP
jgi:FKBP-type peptidyl-prolyl cis-trans isomerase (trigger factor)